MPEKMRPRGKRGVWYADCRVKGVHLRDCLHTTDRRLAERRLAELEFSIERGDYEVARLTFENLVDRYKSEIFPKKSERLKINEEVILRLHLLPAMAGKTTGDIISSTALQYALSRDKSGIPASTLKKEIVLLQNIIRQVKPDFKITSFKFSNAGKN